MEKDLYKILDVKKDASEGEIRKAFLKLAKKLHPDVNPNDKTAEQKFKEVNFAYEVLKDPKKRAQYDQMRAVGADPFQRAGAGAQAGWGPAGMGADAFADFGLGDLFEEIFGGGGFQGRRSGPMGGFGRHQPGGRSPRRQGMDREAEVTVSLAEADAGGERSIELSGGRRFKVKIPAGVEEGNKIKLSGQGEPGHGGGAPGDLILTLHVAPHPFFIREGNDLVVKLPITFSESILGAEVEVPTLQRSVHVKIPKGVSSGQRLKIPGKGLMNARSGQRGDLFVELQIKVPKEPDTQYQEAAANLQKVGFNPRKGLFQ